MVDPHVVDLEADLDSSLPCGTDATAAVVNDVAEAARLWEAGPYVPLLVTGLACDVVEGPGVMVDLLVRALLGRDRTGRVPVAAPAPGRLLVVTQPLDPDEELGRLLADVGLVHHGAGSWVVLPPAVTLTGPARWVRSPRECRWALPDPVTVRLAARQALAVAVRSGRRGNGDHPDRQPQPTVPVGR